MTYTNCPTVRSAGTRYLGRGGSERSGRVDGEEKGICQTKHARNGTRARAGRALLLVQVGDVALLSLLDDDLFARKVGGRVSATCGRDDGRDATRAAPGRAHRDPVRILVPDALRLGLALVCESERRGGDARASGRRTRRVRTRRAARDEGKGATTRGSNLSSDSVSRASPRPTSARASRRRARADDADLTRLRARRANAMVFSRTMREGTTRARVRAAGAARARATSPRNARRGGRMNGGPPRGRARRRKTTREAGAHRARAPA
eukprot:8834-Pelagococcus_subviridis.AAC.2